MYMDNLNAPQIENLQEITPERAGYSSSGTNTNIGSNWANTPGPMPRLNGHWPPV